MNILIADDSADAALSLGTYLALHGHEVRTAADGAETMAKLALFRPDVLVLDLMMPRKNGWEVLDQKADTAEIAPIPVVVLSGYTDVPEPLPARGGVCAVLAKSAEPGAVLGAITRAVSPKG